MVVVASPGLSDIELLFQRDAEWTQDVGSVKSALQKELRLFRDELFGLQMTV